MPSNKSIVLIQGLFSAILLIRGVLSLSQGGPSILAGLSLLIASFLLLPALNSFAHSTTETGIKYAGIVAFCLLAGALSPEPTSRQASPAAVETASPVAPTSRKRVQTHAQVTHTPPPLACGQLTQDDHKRAWPCLKQAFNQTATKVVQFCGVEAFGHNDNYVVVQVPNKKAALALVTAAQAPLRRMLNLAEWHNGFRVFIVDPKLRKLAEVYLAYDESAPYKWSVSSEIHDHPAEKDVQDISNREGCYP